jgi:hypothetical protein
MLERRKVGASYFWLRDSKCVKKGRRNVSRYTHLNFTSPVDGLSVISAA